MAVLLVIGVMDLRVMAAVAAAITIERLAPAGERAARAIGAVVVGAGLLLIGNALDGGGRDRPPHRVFNPILLPVQRLPYSVKT